MDTTLRKAEAQYKFALETYVAGGREVTLQSATEIGQQAIANGLDILTMTKIHQRAVSELLARPLTAEACKRVAQGALEFFTVSLTPFELRQDKWREASAELHHFNAALEHQIAEQKKKIDRLEDKCRTLEEQISELTDIFPSEQLDNNPHDLVTLSNISHVITSTLDLTEMLSIITKLTTQMLNVAATSVVLYDETKNDLWFAAASGDASEYVRDRRLALGQGIAGWVIQHGQPVLAPNVSQDPRFLKDFDQKSDFTTHSMLCVPLQTKGRTIGAISAINKQGDGFNQKDLRLLDSLAASAATAIENGRLYKRARQEIGERRRAEKALRESIDELKLAYEQAIIYAQELKEEIRERKRAQEALAAERASLAKRVEERTAELETSLHLNRKFSQVFAQHLEALEVLHETGLRLMTNLDTDSVLNLILQTALDLIPEATGSMIHFLAEEDGPLLPVVFSAENKAKIVYPSVGVEEIVQQAIETREAIFVPDVAIAANRAKFELPKMRALLVTPLAGEQQPLGTISVYSSEVDVFKEDHQHVLSILAGQAAVAITKARFLKDREQAREREKQTIRQLFQRYVGPTVVNRLVDDREQLALGGKRQEISVLFADIRGFTAFSENQAPERLVGVLNQYLALAVEAILAEEGMLDKFMGDAIMAVFNAPLAQPDHTIRAVRAALAVQKAVGQYNSTLRDHQLLSFGIGVHVGQAVVGNIGTTQQMNYTAIGDTVNLAKRLEECAQGGQIILSQTAHEAVKDHVAVEALGSLVVKGRTEAVRVYVPLADADLKIVP